MTTIPIHNRNGEQVGTYEFDLAELATEINKQLLHDVVVMYESNRRQGNVQTKGRADVQGSKKKMYKQKGTGRARMGNKRTPIRRGGGVTFAKRPIDHSYRLPNKAVRLATRMAILSKFQDNQVTILEDLVCPVPKTKEVVKTLKALKLDGTSCLLAIEKHDPLVWKSARNIARVSVSPASDLNAYDVLHQKQLVVTKAALDNIRERARG
ncbi:MAG: 50S ribosomal protein L4 [Planctomycetota bacterium]|nr:50S ribosomal protein L4 [Planctomycetota bacterium]